MPLEEAVKQYIKGNNKALVVLYQREFEKLLFFAYSFLQDKEAAADQTAALFEKLLQWSAEERKAKLSDDFEQFSKILYTIHKHACLDCLRKLKTQRAYMETEKAQKNLFVKNGEELFMKDALKQIKAVLSDRENEILQLFIEGFSTSEIASKLNINQKTVQNTLHNSRNKVKQLYPSLVTSKN